MEWVDVAKDRLRRCDLSTCSPPNIHLLRGEIIAKEAVFGWPFNMMTDKGHQSQ